MAYSDKVITGLTKQDLSEIGRILGYLDSVAAKKARRFIKGLHNDLKQWSYEETVNFGEMHKILEAIAYIDQRIKIIYPDPS